MLSLQEQDAPGVQRKHVGRGSCDWGAVHRVSNLVSPNPCVIVDRLFFSVTFYFLLTQMKSV